MGNDSPKIGTLYLLTINWFIYRWDSKIKSFHNLLTGLERKQLSKNIGRCDQRSWSWPEGSDSCKLALSATQDWQVKTRAGPALCDWLMKVRTFKPCWARMAIQARFLNSCFTGQFGPRAGHCDATVKTPWPSALSWPHWSSFTNRHHKMWIHFFNLEYKRIQLENKALKSAGL